MQLRTKFNLMLFVVFLIGLGLAIYLTDRLLRQNALEEVIQNARIMLESAAGIREYTAREIAPLLVMQMQQRFLPQAVSAYAAVRNFEVLRTKFPEYTYREAALNPTNLKDRATDWEADIINEFCSNPKRAELITQRDTPLGPALSLSRPIIAEADCLGCHSRAEDAPKSMLESYGTTNGFGWKLNGIIGAQVVSVPMLVPLERAHKTFVIFLGLLGWVFLMLVVLLNFLLHFMVIDPIVQMSRIARDVSLGKPDVPEYVKAGSDEIASLSASFNRMRHSLEQAMKMLGWRK